LDVIESLLPRGGVDLHTDWIRISKAGQTHPNVATVWDVSPDGGWLEQKKKGGEVATGATYLIPNEEGFIVALGNGHRLRMWAIEEDLLAFIAVTPQGSMVTDGILISRSR
jgi:hypothetical protein